MKYGYYVMELLSKHKVLVPVELSDTSKNVLAYAFAIAERHNLEVEIVFVSNDMVVSVTEEYMYIEDFNNSNNVHEVNFDNIYNYFGNVINSSVSYTICDKVAVNLSILNNQINNRKDIGVVCINSNFGQYQLNSNIGLETVTFIEKCKFPTIVVPPHFVVRLHDEFVFFTKFRTEDIESLQRIQQNLINVPRLHMLHISNDFSHKREQDLEQLKNAIAKLNIFETITVGLVSSRSILHFINEYINTHPNTLVVLHMTAQSNWLQRLVKRSITKQLIKMPKRPFVVL